MVRLIQLSLLAFGAALLGSCGNDAGGAADAGGAPAVQKGFEQKSGEMGDDDFDKIVNRYGGENPMMQKGEFKSADEGANRSNKYFNGEIAKREFGDKDYSKKSFWGSKDYAKKVYGGSTDGNQFKKGSGFNSQGAREGSVVSKQSGNRYATSGYASGGAREGGTSKVTKFSDGQIDAKRSSYKQPEITDWRNQRGLTIDDTRSMLGRSN